MFFYSGAFYAITVLLQIICIIHCIRKGNQNWIWLLVFLPMVGCIIYFFMEIVNRRDMGAVQTGVGQLFNPSGSIRKLETNLRFADTFSNRVALADAYLKAGQTARAVELYESSLTGNFSENEYVVRQLITAYHSQQNDAAIISITPKIYKQPQFTRSSARVYYAMALANTGRTEEAEQEFISMKGRFGNFEARYQYAIFLLKNNRREEARKILSDITEEIPQLSRPERRLNQEWTSRAREALKNC